MAVNLLAIALVLVIAGYYAAQGLFALMSLIAAVFGSLLAMGLFEALSGPIAGFRPAYARGATFLLLFFLGLSACRLAADFAVPKGVKLSKQIDSIAGAAIGFFAALVIVGTGLIGVEMLPLHTKLLAPSWADSMGFDRYPEETGMAGDQPGTVTPNVAAPRNVWIIMPDRFTLSLWNAASGRGFGGSQSFASVHPDMTVESYGYRNTVEYAASGVVIPKMVTVDAAYVTNAPADLKRFDDIKDGKAVVVRISVEKGSEPPELTADPDGNFRITPSEVRLVTKQGRQYYPIGDMDKGTTFEPLTLNIEDQVSHPEKNLQSHLVDDYAGGKVIEDWVFQIPADEDPALVEVKQLARVELADLLKGGKPLPVLASSAYPKRAYKENQSTLLVTVTGQGGKPLSRAKVFVMPTTAKVVNVQGEVKKAYDYMTEAIGQINSGTGPWVAGVKKDGVPGEGTLKQQHSIALNQVLDVTDPKTAQVAWSQLIQILLIGTCKPDPAANAEGQERYFNESVEPLLGKVLTDMRGKGETGPDGKLEIKGIAPGSWTIICSARGDDGYHAWSKEVKIEAKSKVIVALTASDKDGLFFPKP